MDADPAEAIFHTSDYDLYAALNLKEAATVDEIKKAYRRLALLSHPDKLASSTLEEQEEGKQRFQQIGYAYAVLNDKDRRERYDATGRTDDVGLGGGEKKTQEEWNEYFKQLWEGEVNAVSIQEFFKAYEGMFVPSTSVVRPELKYRLQARRKRGLISSRPTTIPKALLLSSWRMSCQAMLSQQKNASPP